MTSVGTEEELGLGEIFDDRILGLDSAHVFLVSAQALAARSTLVAEVGCGRGALIDLDQPGGPWQDLRGPARRVIGIDIERAGADNPVIDEFRLIGGDGRWPLDDASVDLAVSDFVLEHVTEPDAFVRELARVLRPGGTFVARTISRHSVLSASAAGRPQRLSSRGPAPSPARPRGAGRLPHRLQDEHPPRPGQVARPRFRMGHGVTHGARAVFQALAPAAAPCCPRRTAPAPIHVDGPCGLCPAPARFRPGTNGLGARRGPYAGGRPSSTVSPPVRHRSAVGQVIAATFVLVESVSLVHVSPPSSLVPSKAYPPATHTD